jgi:hypothetical protein
LVMNPRKVDGVLHIHSEIDDIHDHLGTRVSRTLSPEVLPAIADNELFSCA